VANRFAILMVSVRIGERALPLAWWVKEGAADLGFDAQREVLEKIRAWLPAGASVLLSADRFLRDSRSAALGGWVDQAMPEVHLIVAGPTMREPEASIACR
jgi:hypothetical protein